ncbi:MAG: SDR family oxidoreductase [Gammaproteobacteria bacterium]|nr:SDR family oxidoreductase [Gammaproteobacteria bacterium]
MATNLFDLEGKIALVTGASRGIGEATAKLLAEQGAYVLISSRKLQGCERVVDEIKAAGGKAEALACHIGNMEDIKSVFKRVHKQFKQLDILINNAATNPYFGHILDTDLAAFQKTLDVNIRGYFFMSVEAGKLMRQQRSGCIVNVASINALQPGTGQGVYSLSKAAVVNMTKAFAKECAQYNIRVNALLPGLTETKFAGALFEHKEIYERIIEHIPMQRHAQPQEMANAVLYLVADASSYMTGECLVIDGGWTACGGIME